MSSLRALILCICCGLIGFSFASPEQGIWQYNIIYDGKENPKTIFVRKSLFAGSDIFINIACFPSETSSDTKLKISRTSSHFSCWSEFLHFGNEVTNRPQTYPDNLTHNIPVTKCTNPILLDEGSTSHETHPPPESQKKSDSKAVAKASRRKREESPPAKKEVAVSSSTTAKSVNTGKKTQGSDKNKFTTVSTDNIYLLTIDVIPVTNTPFNLSIEVKMLGPHGYLSAVDWPLLPFYGAMCLVYVILGLAWLIVSFCQWRDLLRIQFWIGGVILLGMLEKATFYAEYQSVNSTGQSVRGAVLLAEFVSCGKRMLARMLVIIVSLGFGIVKPRLGPMLHRVVFVGILYFILASVECYLRVMHPKNDQSNQILVASIPLAVLDSAISWWIFTSLVQTTRTLRLRRNLVKLSLYRHFTNTLIFSVVSSVVFMLYSIHYHRLVTCLTDWKELWVDDAYWHLLFSVLLLVIMILWRPTNNNQRYAFTPLLDAPEDDEDEDEQFVNDAFGVKMRGYRSNSPKPKSTNSVEEDLKWVEENIPSSMADTALPILDSDEEIMTTKFEVSKMQ